MNLSEAIEYFDLARAGEVSESTRRWFYRVNQNGKPSGKLWSLVEILGDKDIRSINLSDLRIWRKHIQQRDSRWDSSAVRKTKKGGLSQDGVRNYIRAAKQFFKWLTTEGIIDENPAQRLPVPPTSTEKPKAIDIDDARQVLAVAEAFCLRDLAYATLINDTGAKLGEIDRLRCDDINLQNGTATIHQYVRRGTYRGTAVKLQPYTIEILSEYQQIRAQIADKDEADIYFAGRLGEFKTPFKDGLPFGVRNNAVIQVLASSACRAGGVASMKVSQLNGTTAVVWEKGRGGYRRSRVVYMDEDARDAIDLWLDFHPQNNDALFMGLYGPMTRDGIYQIVRSLAKEAGVYENANPHAWRHAWSLEALREGADVSTVAKVLGNKPATVMMSYSRWADSDIQERHKQFSWKNGK